MGRLPLFRREDSGATFPRDLAADSTLAFLREGYGFVANRCGRLRSDVFEARLMLRPFTCMMGEEAARVFYEPGRFTRRGARPPGWLRLLHDHGSVAMLDGAAHRHRKAMLMAWMSPASVERLGAQFDQAWREAQPGWTAAGAVVLQRAVARVLCSAALAWCGVSVSSETELDAWTHALDGTNGWAVVPWRGAMSSVRGERHARELVEQVRARTVEATPGSALDIIAWHRNAANELLDAGAAANELLNLLSPTVAVNRYVVFCALALHEHPEFWERLSDPLWLEAFVHEVRRFYPYHPCVGGSVLKPFEWRGHRFVEGDRVLLDLFATNHDPRTWEVPYELRPERFLGRVRGMYELIPQGGGAQRDGHRCAGEQVTIELMKRAVRQLAAMKFEVPEQDLRIDFSRVPAGPSSGFVLKRLVA